MINGMNILKFDGMTGYHYSVPLTAENLIDVYFQALEFTGDWGYNEDYIMPEPSTKCIDIVLSTIQGFIDYSLEHAPDELELCETVNMIGCNLYFSSAGHGAGFFDYNLYKLQDIAKSFSLEFYINDNGELEA